jgi:hypothetical protein
VVAAVLEDHVSGAGAVAVNSKPLSGPRVAVRSGPAWTFAAFRSRAIALEGDIAPRAMSRVSSPFSSPSCGHVLHSCQSCAPSESRSATVQPAGSRTVNAGLNSQDS